MNTKILSFATLFTATIATSVLAENFTHSKQLLATKQCQNCDLTNIGLVTANLSGAKINGSNLTGANLSRANLSGADLRGVNFSGANLYGANLSGADLRGANFTGTDLREAYLANANFTGVNLSNAYLQGAVGIPSNASTPEQIYRLALAEAKEQDHKTAIDYFNQAINIKSDFALAYLGRSVSRYRLGDENGAILDAQKAAELFSTQEDVNGYELSLNFIKAVQAPKGETKLQPGRGNLVNVLGGIGSLLMKLLF